MRVGIMTMQRIVNYGSFLQAYGLKRVIESLGHEVEFVDYVPEPSLVPSYKKSMLDSVLKKSKSVLKMLSPKYRLWRNEQIRSNSTFEEFCKIYEERWLPMLGVSKEKNYCPELDVLVIGSDEVFNCTQPDNNVGYSLQLFGKQNQAERLVSYAASFGSTTLEKLKQYHVEDEIAGLLKEFHAISVRDGNSAMIVQNLIGEKPQINIDPVLLYDFSEIDDIDVPLKDYIIVYAYAGRLSDEEIFHVKQFAKRAGKRLISLGYWQTYCDDYVLASPLVMLAYIKNADFVITDTFHGTVFSIINQKNFCTIIRNTNSEKLGYLLEQFGLRSREVRKIENLSEILLAPIDYGKVEIELSKHRKYAMNYLNKAITPQEE